MPAMADADENRPIGRDWWAKFGKYALSLTDQSFVSGTRFVTTIVVGSVCGAAELGVYALAFSVVVGIQAIQTSLINRPYTIEVNKRPGRQCRESAGSGFVHLLCFAAAVAALIGLAAGPGKLFASNASLASTFLVLAAVLPLIQLREHARQFCFAHLQMGMATVVDVIASAGQLVGLGWLAWTGRLSAASAIGATGIACGLAAAVWLWVDRRQFRFTACRVLPDLHRQWRLGKWDCAGELSFSMQLHGMTWLIAMVLDERAVGIYAACMTVIQALNPFLLGMSSVLIPKTTRALGEGGLAGMHAMVRLTTVLLGGVTGVFAIVASIWGADALEMLYGGNGFDIPSAVVAALVFGVFVEVLGTGAENGLWALERHDLNFRVNGLGAIATVGSAAVCIPLWGVTGAGMGFLVGRIVTTAAQWAMYVSASQRSHRLDDEHAPNWTAQRAAHS